MTSESTPIDTSQNTPRVVIIVQARMSSTRLPGKVLKTVLGRPLLEYLIERLRRVKLAHELVIATPSEPEDSAIIELCQKLGVSTYQGALHDVLGRYASAAREYKADIVVRVCSDCVVIDPAVVDEAISYLLDPSHHYDWVGNMAERHYPRGYEVEVFTRQALEHAEREAKEEYEREHVTPFLYYNPELFSLGSVTGECALGEHRWVVDTPEDFELIKRIIEALYPIKPDFVTENILRLFEEHPEWMDINAHIKQKPVR